MTCGELSLLGIVITTALWTPELLLGWMRQRVRVDFTQAGEDSNQIGTNYSGGHRSGLLCMEVPSWGQVECLLQMKRDLVADGCCLHPT